MTPDLFIRWAESVFGEYRPAMKQEVLNWLRPHDEYFIAALRDVTLREHPSVYKVPPGVHELEAFKLESYERGHELEGLRKVGTRKEIGEPVENVTEAEALENARKLREMMG